MKNQKLLMTGFLLMFLLISCGSPPPSDTPLPATAPDVQPQVTKELPTEIVEIVPSLTPYAPGVEHLLLANFEFCGDMGSAGVPNNTLENECVSLADRAGKTARLQYRTPEAWAAFWIKLNAADFTPYDRLVFFARSEPSEGSLPGFKIEFWGTNHDQHTIYTSSKLRTDWQKFEIPLRDFECLPSESCFQWSDVDELVFTFEKDRSGTSGTVYLTDIYVESHEGGMPVLAVVPENLLVSDFDNGIAKNRLGGEMGVACPADGCPAPNRLIAAYVFEEGVLRLEYAITEWTAFWIKLQKADLSNFSRLRFDIRSEPGYSTTRQFKVEIKRGNELGVQYFGGVTDAWQTVELELSGFRNPGWNEVLSGWTDMDELVFTFEQARSGGGGIIYLDTIEFLP